ncbi:MAG: PIN domain-containing protein [Caldilineaceae bacterium]
MKRVFLDTNVFIIGAADAESPEAAILDWAGFGLSQSAAVEVVLSEALLNQITRVARRVQHKDWAGQILAQILRGMNLHFVVLDESAIRALVEEGVVPREDVEMYLTARDGRVDCFISANHKLVRALAEYTGAFVCYTPAEFVAEFLR